MHCSDDERVCSVKKENNLGFYRIHTIWKKDGFFANITSKDGAWRGEMTASDVSKMSALLQMEPETYLKQCKEALTSHDGQPGMVYSIENGSFTWKKVIDEDSGMKMKMGSVRVEPTSFVDTIQNLVHAALNCNKKLQRELNELNQDRNKTLENKNDLLKKLNELIEAKNTMENDLYSKFVLLLNSKKRKIQTLENKLEKEHMNRKKNKKFEKSDDPYEVDTENDDDDDDGTDENSGKEVSKKIIDKSFKKNDSFSETGPDRKKIKNFDEFNFEKEDSTQQLNYSRNISPEPSTSKEVVKNNEKEIPFTKDELLDYFYGNS